MTLPRGDVSKFRAGPKLIEERRPGMTQARGDVPAVLKDRNPAQSTSSSSLPNGKDLFEVRFHGRGGQGTVVASVLLAEAAFLEGRGVQAFPFFGVERRGAPVTAYTRIGLGPVRLACAVDRPDALVVMDSSLLSSLRGKWESGLRPGGHVLLNSTRVPTELSGLPAETKPRNIDAAAIARKHGLGSAASPLVNTAILGAFARLTGLVQFPALEKAIRSRVPAQVEENLAAAREAWDLMGAP